MTTVVLVHGRAQEYTEPGGYEASWKRHLEWGLRREPILDPPVQIPELALAFYGYLLREDFVLRAAQQEEELRSEAVLHIAEDLPQSIRDDLLPPVSGGDHSPTEDSRAEHSGIDSTSDFRSMDDNIPQDIGIIGFDIPIELGKLTGRFDNGIVGSWIVKKLAEGVDEYLKNEDNFRDAVQVQIDKTMSQVLPNPVIGDAEQNIILLGYSLGSVAAYDWLVTTRHPARNHVKGFITFGSILGITLVRERLARSLNRDLEYPAGIERWVNVLDEDDPATSGRKLAPYFLDESAERIEDKVTFGRTPDQTKLMAAHDGFAYISSLVFRDALAEMLDPAT